MSEYVEPRLEELEEGEEYYPDFSEFNEIILTNTYNEYFPMDNERGNKL